MHALTSHKGIWSLALLLVLAVCSNGCDSDSANSTSPTLAPAGSGWDPTPPAAPLGLEVNHASAEGFKLTWLPNAEEDLAGYKVYVYSPSPYRPNSYVCLQGGSMLDRSQTWCSYSGDTSPGYHYFWVTALDTEGNESYGGAPFEFYFAGGGQEGPSMSDRTGGTTSGEPPHWSDTSGPSPNPRHDYEDGSGKL